VTPKARRARGKWLDGTDLTHSKMLHEEEKGGYRGEQERE